MTLKSMTAFARSEGSFGPLAWYWELRSVNGRGLDLRLRLPSGHEALEVDVRKAAQRRLARGSVQISLQVSRSAETQEVRVNEQALARLSALAKALHSDGVAAPRADGLLALRGVLENVEPEEGDEQREARFAAMRDGFEEALSALIAMREEEGARIHEVVAAQIDDIERLARQAEADPSRSPEAIRDKLTQQVAKLIETSAALDQDRLHQEAVLLATKADVREELDRLYAHVAAARDLLAGGEPAGRRLDFLTQEFNREVNTLCSKSNAVDLTGIGLDLKAVVDQMREQVQNVE
jgi:uncharacterized protein (TIGR00255 family)